MDRDDFIITVYSLVCEHYQGIVSKLKAPLRRAGFSPCLSDGEVICIEICGELFKLPTNKDMFHYFAHHYRHFFPALKERSRFVRQAAALWKIQAGVAYFPLGIHYPLSIVGGKTS